MRFRLEAIAACALLAGCYTYRPIDTASPADLAAGTGVEVRLTPEGTERLASQLGPEARYVRGQWLGADSTGVRLAVSSIETTRRIAIPWKGEEVTLPRADIAAVQERKLAVGASGLLGGVVLGGLVAATAAFSGHGSVSGVGGGTPGSPAQ
ncbi:MAG TPA: hypothetical protein VFS11_00245 [Gemmatimonadales bacterium]|nr:hypothetical protein [Gemmatimonadales bacterium]